MDIKNKKAMLCFYKGDINNDISILEDLDSKGYEVHLFNDIDEENLQSGILLDLVKSIYGNEVDQYDIYISSNIEEFIMIQYILYRNFLKGALFLNSKPEHCLFENIYSLILDKESNISAENFYIIKEKQISFRNCSIYDGDFKFYESNNNEAYLYKEIVHFYSIKNDEEYAILNLDNSTANIGYNYHYNLQFIDEFIQIINRYFNTINPISYYDEITQQSHELKNKLLGMVDFEKSMSKLKLDNHLYKGNNSDKCKLFLSSFLLNTYGDKKYMEYSLELLIESVQISKYNRFFAYYQCVRNIFVNKMLSDDKIGTMLEKLYEIIYDDFLPLCEGYEKIGEKNRDNKMVFVFTTQFLGVDHSPTKLALDICYSLVKDLGKNVVLINTKEVCTTKGSMLLFGMTAGDNINDNYNSVGYKGINLPFVQPESNMPDDDEIIKLLELIKEYKPHLVINIGACLVGDLCSNLIPTITIPLGTNGYSKSTFYVVNDETEYYEYSKKHNRSTESLIVSKFAFELKPKHHTFTKQQLRIPKNKFIISVIGNRLNEELDEEFLKVLDKSCRNNDTYVVFISKFDFTDSLLIKYHSLANNYKNLGYHRDLLGVLENVDIYLNPRRMGGGTSAIYAMYLGKPVVSLNYGDVANNVGKEFCVNNYSEMYEMIDRYCNDKTFYNMQGYRLKEKALKLTNISEFVTNIYLKFKTN